MNERPGASGGRDPWTDRLSEYLDGELRDRDRERLEAHLATCPACSAALADLRQVVARARSLADAPPETDLWPAIEARLVPRAGRTRARRDPGARWSSWWSWRFELGLPQLAGAAVMLVVLSAGVVWVALRGLEPREAPGGLAGGPGLAAPAGQGAHAVSLAGPGDARYDAAVAELERTLAEGQGRLDPRTLRVIEENLRIIDRAIEDARRAVAADPGNAWLRSHLATTMMRKVDLLRSATLLAAQS